MVTGLERCVNFTRVTRLQGGDLGETVLKFGLGRGEGVFESRGNTHKHGQTRLNTPCVLFTDRAKVAEPSRLCGSEGQRREINTL